MDVKTFLWNTQTQTPISGNVSTLKTQSIQTKANKRSLNIEWMWPQRSQCECFIAFRIHRLTTNIHLFALTITRLTICFLAYITNLAVCLCVCVVGRCVNEFSYNLDIQYSVIQMVVWLVTWKNGCSYFARLNFNFLACGQIQTVFFSFSFSCTTHLALLMATLDAMRVDGLWSFSVL